MIGDNDTTTNDTTTNDMTTNHTTTEFGHSVDDHFAPASDALRLTR